MAIYKTISSQALIRKVLRDLRPASTNWLEDAIEWIGEALEHIGASTQLETKQKVLTVKEYKTLLPSDLYYVNMVATSSQTGTAISTQLSELKDELATLNASIASNPNQDLYAQLRDITGRIITLQAGYFKDVATLTPLKYGTTTFPKDIHCSKCVNEVSTATDWYIIENGYLKTSFLTGELCISYMAFPTDVDCYPLVPDDISFREAIFWYIYKKLLLGGYIELAKMQQNGIKYDFADERWRYYCTQARNNANYPDIDRMESFMNQWVRLVPDLNRHENNFTDLGDRETLYRG
tara:strand:+ start:4384 stop:5265 length:882 start_codon:yes stop_codon:yes gene_type:complete